MLGGSQAVMHSRAAAVAMLMVAAIAAMVVTTMVGSSDRSLLVEQDLHRDPYLLPRTGSFLMRETDERPKHANPDSEDEKRRRQQEEVHKALHHLSSTALVQRAASDCAADSKCVPSVDELVKRAASTCAKDPACVCDWGRYPKQCFLSEVQRHEQLVKAAKNLEKELKAREQEHVETKSAIQELEGDDKDFATVLGNGQRALEGGDFAEAKHALAHAEFLHEKMVHSGGANTPAEQRQEEELKRFAKDVVEKEARMPAHNERGERSEHEERDSERERHGESRVERQLSSLTHNVQTLMKAVGSIEQQRELKELPQSSDSSPRGKMEQLVQEVGVLSGKLTSMEKQSDHRSGAPEPSQDLAQGGREDRGREGKARAEALSHQESNFAQAIAHGEREAFKHNLQEARVALQEARYYHSEVVRLRGLAPSASCHPCDALSRTIHRVALSAADDGRGRMSSLYQERSESDRRQNEEGEDRRREAVRGSDRREEDRRERPARADRSDQRDHLRDSWDRDEARRRQEARHEESNREKSHREETHREETHREDARRVREQGREGGDSPPSAHKLEMGFDAALSSGERDLLRGKVPSAVEQDEKAKRLLHKLDKWTLGENDGMVKHEMAEALASFTKGVERRGGRLSGAVRGQGHEEGTDKERTEGERRERERREERKEKSVEWARGGGREDGRAGRGDRREPTKQVLRGVEDKRRGRVEEAKARLERRAGRKTREEYMRMRAGDEKKVAALGQREAEDKREMRMMRKEEDHKEHLPAYRKVSWKQAPFPQDELKAIYSHFSHS